MSRRGAVLEIQGHTIAYATHRLASAVVSWATTIKPTIIEIPQGSVLSVDYDTLASDAGGTTLTVQGTEEQLLHFSQQYTTSLSSAVSKTATSIPIKSQGLLSSSGTVWIGKEAVSYTSIVSDTLTGCARGQLGTTAEAHTSGATCYSYVPSLLGRKCTLTWFDLDNTSSQTTRYTGIIDAVDFSDARFVLSIVSTRIAFEDATALSAPQGKGRVVLDVNGPFTQRLQVAFASDEQGQFLTDLDYSYWPYRYLRINDEVIRYGRRQVTYPAYSQSIATVSSAYQFSVGDSQGFEPGRAVQITNSSGTSILATGAVTSRQALEVYHSAAYTASVGDLAQTYGIADVLYSDRGALDTKRAEHEVGDEVAEYRVLEGNQADILLWLMLSIDGDKANTDYDILPTGWGAGIDSSFIDLTAFEDVLRPRCSWRRYVLQEEIRIQEFMAQVALCSNTRIYWGTDGILTVNEVDDLYPLDTATKTLSVANVLKGSTPELRLDMTKIRNVWEWGSDYDVDGDRRSTMRVEVAESRRLYGERKMPDMRDQGMRFAENAGIQFAVAQALLSMRSAPVSIIVAQILFDDQVTYNPGDLVSVTLTHMPNMTGLMGISNQIFEVLSYEPQEEQATATLTIARRKQPGSLGHIAPVLRVQSVAGSAVTVEPRSDSYYAPASARFIPPGNTSFDGTEDVHWFLENDSVRCWDVSTYGSATPTQAATTISSVNYGTRVVTLASAPGWLAAGDLIKLDDYSTVAAGANAANRASIFIALADDTTELIGSADPYRWGL